MRLVQQLNADFTYARGALRTLQRTKPIAQNPTRVFPAIFDELAARYGDAPALISDHERLSYRALAARANRYARWAQAQGLAKGDVVCLIMPNRPEYMAIWLGFALAATVLQVALTRAALLDPAMGVASPLFSGAVFLAARRIAEVAIERPLRWHFVALGIDLAVVIPQALVLVGQDVVGGADLLEPVRRLGLSGIDVGVVALGELAVGGTDRRLAVGLLHAKRFIRIFCHR